MLRRARPEPFILALTAAWIIGLFSASTAPLQDLWRPLLIGLALASVLASLVALIPGRGRWPSIALRRRLARPARRVAARPRVALISAWRIGVDVLRRRQGRAAVREPGDRQVGSDPDRARLGGGRGRPRQSGDEWRGQAGGGTTGTAPLPDVAERPSMYVVLLDGYPSAEILVDRFGFDAGAVRVGPRGAWLRRRRREPVELQPHAADAVVDAAHELRGGGRRARPSRGTASPPRTVS